MKSGGRPQRTPARGVRRVLALLAVLLSSLCLATPPTDPDLGWHLLGGAWIVAHRAVPASDFINSFNPSWHDYHWLGQLGLFGLFSLGGYRLLSVALALLMCALLLILSAIVASNRLAARHGSVAALFLLFSAALLLQIAQIRPQMVALAGVAYALWLMLHPPWKWELLVLAPLTVLLANIHVYWVFVPFLWFAYRCVPRLFRRRSLSPGLAWGGLALLSAAAFVSPYGLFVERGALPGVLMNYALVYEYLSIPSILRSTVGEFRSPFAMPGPGFYLLLLSIVLFLRNVHLRRLLARPGSAVGGAVAFALAASGAKYVGVFAILGLPLLLDTQAAVVRDTLARIDTLAGGRRVSLLVVAAAFAAMLLAWWPPVAPSEEALRARYPLGACEAIPSLGLARRGERDHLRILTHFDYGGWCRWFIFEKDPSADIRVTTDNRTQGVPPEFYADSMDLFFVRHAWARTLGRWAPDAIVIRKDYPLAQVLALAHDQWAMRYEDDDWAVFVPSASS